MEKLALELGLGDQEDCHKLKQGEGQREVACRRQEPANAFGAGGRGVLG